MPRVQLLLARLMSFGQNGSPSPRMLCYASVLFVIGSYGWSGGVSRPIARCKLPDGERRPTRGDALVGCCATHSQQTASSAPFTGSVGRQNCQRALGRPCWGRPLPACGHLMVLAAPPPFFLNRFFLFGSQHCSTGSWIRAMAL